MASIRGISLEVRVAIGQCLVVTLGWLLTHRYQGIAQDARIYAIQAVATFRPEFASDLYLQHTSQDRYTVFSPFYGQMIRLMGLSNAAVSLFVVGTLYFYWSAWRVAWVLTGRERAWTGILFLSITVSIYGASEIFRVCDDYLTARLIAEAILMSALACQLSGKPYLASGLAASGLLVHPIMALPAIVVLLLLNLSYRLGIVALLLGMVTALLLTLIGGSTLALAHYITVLDAPWLQVVEERSQFLFLQHWSVRDWQLNLRPFASLATSSLIFTNALLRKYCAAALLVGACGLGLAFLATQTPPVALLIQGQPWRWVWVAGFSSILLAIPSILEVCRHPHYGYSCAALIVGSWVLSPSAAILCGSLALLLLLLRRRISAALLECRPLLPAGLAIAIGSWWAWELWSAVTSMPITERYSILVQTANSVAAVRILLVLPLALAAYFIGADRGSWLGVLLCSTIFGLCIAATPTTFAKLQVDQQSDWDDFASWRARIPLTSSVYVANGVDSPTFAWFTLGRTSYLSLDQSAGVVFSRETALEVKRRSEVLLPLMPEDWKLLTKIRSSRGSKTKPSPVQKSLTAISLTAICSDVQLGYLVAHENVGYRPVTQLHAGLWQGWNLYDCGLIRAEKLTDNAGESQSSLPTAR